MKYLSLFSGVEGFGLGIDGEPIGFSEIDKYASMVLKYHFPNTKNYGDCTTINYDEVPNFDLLTGGSPCQDFSIAGKRKGLGGSRSSLAWEFIRALRSKQPRYFIWENVKGVMSSRNGWDFANLLSAFSESGYDLWWQVLNAKDFGVPQNRERIFVVGFREGSPKEVFFKPKDSGQIEIVGTTKPDESNRIGQRDRTFSTDGIMSSLEATHYKQPPQILINLTKDERQGSRVYDSQGIAQSLTANTGGKGGKTGLYAIRQPLRFLDRNQKNIEGDYAFTIDASQTSGLKIGDRVRKLMPIECERLMSWPDDWTKWGMNEKGEKMEISDSQRYKMCGNGVVSAVVKEIFKELIQNV